MHSVTHLAEKGKRVLGVAKAKFLANSSALLPIDPGGFEFEWLGLIAFHDPIRPEVPAAIEECHRAGIRVIMMTGDHPQTAKAIASQAGFDPKVSVMTGLELETLDDSLLLQKLQEPVLFARMIPQQKLRVVKLLKSSGEVVGMTGDGVNDAPSLKWADVGIAMGARGTDVAREASDLVLTDDHFASIVAGIRRGRLIFKNIKKALGYIVSIHVPIAGLSILPLLLGWPILLIPVQIVFLELIIDPACTLLFESQTSELDIMNARPRSLNSKLFRKKDYLKSFLQGTLVLGSILLVFMILGEPSRSIAFLMTVLCNVALIIADLTEGSITELKNLLSRSRTWILFLGLTGILILIYGSPFLRELFKFPPLLMHELRLSLGSALGTFALLSLWNRMGRWD